MSQGKKARVFSREFKLRAVERMIAGEGSSALARELQLRRKLLYEWKDHYLVGGVEALRTRGRPRRVRCQAWKI
jgi:transposase